MYKKIRYRMGIILILLFFSVPVIFSQSIPPEIGNIVTAILNDELMILFDLHQNTEDTSPVFTDKRVSIQTNLLPTLLPFTVANIAAKVKVLPEPEESIVPQIDLSGGYQSMTLLSLVPQLVPDAKDFKGSSIGYYLAGNLTKTVAENTRFFLGSKYSYTSLKIDKTSLYTIMKSSPGVDTLTDSALNLVDDVTRDDLFVFAGLEYQSGESNSVAVQMGYGLKYKKIVAKIILSSGITEFGLSIYPEGLLVIQPVWSIHFRF